MDAQTLKLEIKVGTDGLVQGLKLATDGVDGAAQQMRNSFKHVGAGAGESAVPLSKFTDVIKDYRSEMKQEARIGRFLAADIASMGIASKGAASEITMLVGAFAIGGGIGVAIESVKMLITAFNEAGHKAEEFRRKAIESINQLSDKSEDYVASIHGETEAQKMQRKDVDPLERQAAGKKDELKNKTDELAEAENKLARAQQVHSQAAIGPLKLLVATRQDAIDKLRAELAIIDGQLQAAKTATATVSSAAAGQKSKEDKRDAENEEIEHNHRMLALQAERAVGVEKIEMEAEAKIAEIRARANSTEEQDAEEIAEVRKNTAVKTDEYIQQYRDQVEKEQTARTNRIIQAEMKAQEALSKYFEQKSKERLDRYMQWQQKMEQFVTSAVEGAAKMGDAFGDVFAGLITGQKHWMDVVKLSMKQALGAIRDVAVAQITAAALKSGAEAYGSQAGIPIIGPALGAAAMATAIGMVMGLVDMLPSAAGGWGQVPGDTLAMVHKNEMVLPEMLANPLRDMLKGGSMGGGVHLHFHEPVIGDDGIRDLAKHPAFARGFREAQRLGRIS
jgi:hypothetical protein